MYVRRVLKSVQYGIISTKRIKLYIQPPWSAQCRKADLHIAHYGRPLDTFSFGFTIPFVVCFCISLGTRMNWWRKNTPPTFNGTTVGFWFFIGMRMASMHMKIGNRSILKSISFKKE